MMLLSRHRRVVCAGVALCFGGCDRKAPTVPPPVEGPRVIRTTDPEQAITKLDGKIAHLERRVDVTRDVTQRRTFPISLARFYRVRAHYLGTLSDYARAQQMVDRAMDIGWRRPEPYLERAAMRAALHDFQGALDDIAQARLRRADDAETKRLEALVWANTGRTEDALRVRATRAKQRSLPALTDLALSLASVGRLEEADAAFENALEAARDPSPLAVASTWFQRGFMWERNGNHKRASTSYERALQRLPHYAPLVTHQAGLLQLRGADRAAAQLLLRLLPRSEDPEVLAQLAATGHPGAPFLVESARAGYESLLAEHPLAFADHAARFYLGPGRDAARAVALAHMNLANRANEESFQLFLDAAYAAETHEDACLAADRASRTVEHPSAYLLFAVARAYESCGRAEEAEASLALVGSATRAR